jgi:hypothetical protein
VSDRASGQAAQQNYWNQLVLLKTIACFVRRYRDEQGRWITRIGIFKAVVTSGTIGAWAIWKDYAFIWGVLLGVAQVLDAAKEFIPQTTNRRGAAECVTVLETMLIDAQFEWYEIFAGKHQAGEIMERWRKLARFMTETEENSFRTAFQ